VFRVGLTAKTTLRTLNRMICQFYGHPGTDRAFAIALLTATRAEDILTRLRSLTVSPARAYQATPRASYTTGPLLPVEDSLSRRAGPLPHRARPSPAAGGPAALPLLRPDTPATAFRPPGAGSSPPIPQLLWPEWSVRFTPSPRCAHPDAFRAAMSVCLLIPGRFEKNEPKTAAELRAFRPRHASVILRRLVTQSGDGVLTAICLLAGYLDEHGAPIDYQRRRTLTTEHVLTEQQWKQLCQHAQTHPGKGQSRRGPSSRYLLARRYLFQLLTGADLNDTRHMLAYRGPGDRARHLNAVQKTSTPLRNALHGHAVCHLNELGIDEPVPGRHQRASAQNSSCPVAIRATSTSNTSNG
jgi:hypothetical protein